MGISKLTHPVQVAVGLTQLDCGVHDNRVDAHLGSSPRLASSSNFEPCGAGDRGTVFFYLRAGSTELSRKRDLSNPSAGKRIHNIEIFDDDEPRNLTEAQLHLFEISHQDLMNSCTAYFYQPNNDRGQQLLTDLQRLEHLVHQQLGLQGDQPRIQGNTALIAQNLQLQQSLLHQSGLSLLELAPQLRH